MSSSHLHDGGKVICDNPIRSPLDGRSYLLEELGNDLRVMWIHSPGAEKSTVVMNVESGAFNDGHKKGDIAHATEHFLFMGCGKYPRRDELDERIAKHGGRSNGTTSETRTKFWAEINTKAADEKAGAKMEEVFDVLFQHFIDPAFNPDTIQREINTISNEFTRQEREDFIRVSHLDGSLSNPEHPRSWAFLSGNRKSLGDVEKLLPKVIEHYKKTYCAGLMRCVMVSPLPIKDLQDRFRATLAAIPNRGLSRKVWDTIPRFLEKDLATVTFVEPVTDVDILGIKFYFPGKEDDGYSARGAHSLHLLTQRAEGSVHDVLTGKGLIHTLGGKLSYEHTNYREMSIWAHLTKAGVKNYQDVVQEVYHMIALMKAAGPQQKRVEEVTRLDHIHFCTSHTSDFSLAQTVADNMLRPYLRPENLVYGSNEISIGSMFNAEDIVKTLGFLRPENMRLMLLSKEVKYLAVQEEKWYGTKWGARKISAGDMAKYTAAANLPLDQLPSELTLPPPNPLITQKDFEGEMLGLQRGRQAQAPGTADEEEKRRPPPKALQTGKSDIWFAPGEKPWAEPRIKINMRIRPNNVFTDAECAEKTGLFLESALRATAPLSDRFGKAGMSYSAGHMEDSLILSVTGFKDVIQPMLMELLPALRHHQPTEADFNAIKEDYLQRYQSARYNDSMVQNNDHLDLLTSEHGFTLEQGEAALKAITFEDVRKWGTAIFNTAQFQFFISGDITEAEAKELWPICQEQLALSWRHGEEPPRIRARLPPSGRISLFKRSTVDPRNKNSSVNAVIFFAPSRRAQYIAAPTLLVQILKAKAFDKLRTEQALGMLLA
ncbi:hypothetical protein RB597_007008 [Gaeumannomyces tritici]